MQEFLWSCNLKFFSTGVCATLHTHQWKRILSYNSTGILACVLCSSIIIIISNDLSYCVNVFSFTHLKESLSLSIHLLIEDIPSEVRQPYARKLIRPLPAMVHYSKNVMTTMDNTVVYMHTCMHALHVAFGILAHDQFTCIIQL